MDTYSVIVISMYVPMNICSSRKKHISAWAGDQYPLSIATSTSPAMSTLRQNQKKNSIIDCNTSSSLSDCSLITKITCHILVTVKHANIQGKTFWHYPPLTWSVLLPEVIFSSSTVVCIFFPLSFIDHPAIYWTSPPRSLHACLSIQRQKPWVICT